MFVKKKWTKEQRASIGVKNDNLSYKHVTSEFEQKVQAFSDANQGSMDLEIKLLVDAVHLARSDAGNLEDEMKKVECTMPNDKYIELYSYTTYEIEVKAIMSENIAQAKQDTEACRLATSLHVLKYTQDEQEKLEEEKSLFDDDLCLTTCKDLGKADIQFMSTHSIPCEDEDEEILDEA